MCAFTTDFDQARAGYSPDRLDALQLASPDVVQNFGAVIRQEQVRRGRV
jgi:hypothetical protein